MRDALMPLLEKTIADADWDKVEWTTPTWEFQIIEGHFRFSYSIGSAENKPGERPRFRPVLHDGGFGEFVEDSPLAGNIYVTATYNKSGIGKDYGKGAMYNPNSGESIEEWASNFVRQAMRFEK